MPAELRARVGSHLGMYNHSIESSAWVIASYHLMLVKTDGKQLLSDGFFRNNHYI